MKNADVIAVDPGASGGIAELKGGEITLIKMPDNDGLLSFFENNPSSHYLVENVGFHVKGNSAPRSVTFARHCERIRAYLDALHYQYQLVLPKKWQSIYDLPHGLSAEIKAERKREVKRLMIEKYTKGVSGKITLNTADALGILDWYLTDGRNG